MRRLSVPIPAQMPSLRPPAHLSEQGLTPVGCGSRQRPVHEVRFDEVHHGQALAVNADEAVEDVPVVELLPRDSLRRTRQGPKDSHAVPLSA